jgi:hypothetical protein
VTLRVPLTCGGVWHSAFSSRVGACGTLRSPHVSAQGDGGKKQHGADMSFFTSSGIHEVGRSCTFCRSLHMLLAKGGVWRRKELKIQRRRRGREGVGGRQNLRAQSLICEHGLCRRCASTCIIAYLRAGAPTAGKSAA